MTSELPALPPDFEATRDSLHRVAEKVLAPARIAATGDEFSLEVNESGFGTPVLPDGGSVRVEVGDLVVESIAGDPVRLPITTLKRAALAVELDGEGLDDVGLVIEEQSAAVLNFAFHLADGVLRELRESCGHGQDPSPIRLWPEHFDIAFDMGIGGEGTKAGYGLSPGDANHAEPYFYVAPWTAPNDADGWNAVAFTGAELGWNELRLSPDPRAAALEFLTGRFEALRSA